MNFIILTGCTRDNRKTIVIWNQMRPSTRAVLNNLLVQFKKEHPAYSFKEIYYETEELRSKFIITALGGSGPELVYGPSDSIAPYSEMKIILPMNEYFDEDFLKNFDRRSLVYINQDFLQLGDTIGNHLTLVFNKDMVPVPPKTISELIDQGIKLTKDLDGDQIIDQYALVWNYTEPFFFIPFLGGYGGWIMDDKNNPTLNSHATVRASRLILDLKSLHKIIPRECDYDLANSLFKQKKAAMIINGPWSWGDYEKAGINYGIARIPKIDETGLWPTPMVSPLGYSMNYNISKDKIQITVELLKFLNSAEAQLEFTKSSNSLPSRIDAQNSSFVTNNEILNRSKDQMLTGKPMPITTELRAVWDGMRPAYQSILNGTISPEDAAKKMQDDTLRLIKEMRDN